MFAMDDHIDIEVDGQGGGGGGGGGRLQRGMTAAAAAVLDEQMVGVDGYAGPEAVGAFQPVRLFVYKHGALYGPGEILTMNETTTIDDLRREAARLVGIPVGKMDAVQLYVVVDHKYGRITSLQQLCPSDSIVVTTRDDASESLEDFDAAMADSQVFDGSSIYETRPRNAVGKRKLAQRNESFVKMLETFQRYGMDPKLKRTRANSTWYEHRLLAEAERYSPGFCRECDEERRRNRGSLTIHDVRERARRIVAEARKAKDEQAQS